MSRQEAVVHNHVCVRASAHRSGTRRLLPPTAAAGVSARPTMLLPVRRPPPVQQQARCGAAGSSTCRYGDEGASTAAAPHAAGDAPEGFLRLPDGRLLPDGETQPLPHYHDMMAWADSRLPPGRVSELAAWRHVPERVIRQDLGIAEQQREAGEEEEEGGGRGGGGGARLGVQYLAPGRVEAAMEVLGEVGAVKGYVEGEVYDDEDEGEGEDHGGEGQAEAAGGGGGGARAHEEAGGASCKACEEEGESE